jgi:WD40 repeat protein
MPIAVARNNGMVASALWDGAIDVRTIQTGSRRVLEDNYPNVTSIALSADYSVIATTSSASNSVQLWHLEADTRQVLEDHTALVITISFSSEGKLASGGEDGHVRLWSDKSGVFERSLVGGVKKIWSVVFSGDGLTLASVVMGLPERPEWFWGIQVWGVGSDTCPITIDEHHSPILAVALSKDGTLLAAALQRDNVRL